MAVQETDTWLCRKWHTPADLSQWRDKEAVIVSLTGLVEGHWYAWV